MLKFIHIVFFCTTICLTDLFTIANIYFVRNPYKIDKSRISLDMCKKKSAYTFIFGGMTNQDYKKEQVIDSVCIWFM